MPVTRPSLPHAAPERRASGFTLIELMIALVVLGILIALAAPSFQAWILNGQIRSAAGRIAEGLRDARATAMQRNRRVTFMLCGKNNNNDAASGYESVTALITHHPAAGCGQTVAAENEGAGKEGNQTGSAAAAIAKRNIIAGGSAWVKNTGAWDSLWKIDAARWSVTFDPMGRIVPYPASGAVIGTQLVYEIDTKSSVTDNIRPLNVAVTRFGMVKICDPRLANTSGAPLVCPSNWKQ